MLRRKQKLIFVCLLMLPTRFDSHFMTFPSVYLLQKYLTDTEFSSICTVFD